MSLLLRIAERALNRPLLVHPDKLPLIMGVLQGRIPLGDVKEWSAAAEERIDQLPPEAQAIMRGPGPNSSRFVGTNQDIDPATGAKTGLPYRRTADGTAIIPVLGSLINRGAWLGSYSGETSYEGLKFQIGAAAADPRATSILLDIESPGGEAVGAFEVADAVRAAAKQKQVVAVVNGMAASAAYAIASGASKIVTTPTGVAGSIGVVMLHADYSRALDKAGITPSLIFAGNHKVDGNPFEPLPQGVRDDLQREVDQFYDLFVQTVAAGRKSMSSAAIRDTQARVFIGEEAVNVGLADAVGSFESTLSDLSTRNPARSRAFQQGRSSMTKPTGEPGADTPDTVTNADHDVAIAAARSEGVTEGAKAANDRISAIVANEKVKGKVEIALDLAMKSPGMSADDVVAFVAGLPAAAATAGTKSIAERMNGQGADLSLGGPIVANGPKKDTTIDTKAIYANRAASAAAR